MTELDAVKKLLASGDTDLIREGAYVAGEGKHAECIPLLA